MKAFRIFVAVLIALVPASVTLPASLTAASQTPDTPEQPTETRMYPVEYVSLESAAQIAESVCRSEHFERRSCEVRMMEREGTLLLTATPEAHGRLTSLLETADVPPRTQAFHIVVLEAGSGPGAQADAELPEGARQALADVRQFLPFESFRVVDSGWVQTSREAQTYLTGPNAFRVSLWFRGSAEGGRPLMVESFQIDTIEVVSHLTQGGRTTTRERREVLATSFGIAVGETVVVGTSKLDGGDTALVVLVTAVE